MSKTLRFATDSTKLFNRPGPAQLTQAGISDTRSALLPIARTAVELNPQAWLSVASGDRHRSFITGIRADLPIEPVFSEALGGDDWLSLDYKRIVLADGTILTGQPFEEHLRFRSFVARTYLSIMPAGSCGLIDRLVLFALARELGLETDSRLVQASTAYTITLEDGAAGIECAN